MMSVGKNTVILEKSCSDKMGIDLELKIGKHAFTHSPAYM